ncbi:hypothetical protein AJ80_00107 [Polytolypa hystricis UAMH7299]|uniref:Protein DML1 n=1 Tax=Polytolypa hystricis (strain UAMH7299) TaxID=1447883 RepID=A0A2B7Z5U5_POLH7|nr:hypothetical protein AJ80_00107 [Polytolypa hystricis UAMH7299]
MHEIITLQLGQRSNYLATHFWNLQESYFTYSADEVSPVDHNVHFRTGIGADGTETFTPRTVIYDLKGGFGTLRKFNALYEAEQEVGIPKGLWDGNEVVQQQPTIPQNEYQKSLDLGLPAPQLATESVRYWSDFNRLFYHPRSIVQLNEYELNSSLMPFEDWAMGEDLFRSLDREHDLLDRDFRPFAEECDQLQGIQIFSGTDDAWGGFAARYIDRLRDEFGKKSIWFWGLEDGVKGQRSKQLIATANSARSITEISPQTSAYVPVQDPPRYLSRALISGLPSEWYSSALISTAVESMTLPTRLHSYRGHAPWLPDEGGPRTIFSLHSSITSEKDGNGGKPVNKEAILTPEDGEANEDENLLKDFDVAFSWANWKSTKQLHVFEQTQVTRSAGQEAANDGPNTASGPLTGQRRSFQSGPTVQRFHSSLAFPILDSFPHNLFANQGPPGSTVSVRAALTTSSHVGDQIKQLQKFVVGAVPVDEREMLHNGLGEISESYQEGWDSGSDFGDD